MDDEAVLLNDKLILNENARFWPGKIGFIGDK